MSVEVPRPASFEASFAARLRNELDSVPASPLPFWPVMGQARRTALATAAALAVAAALVLSAVGALAYSRPDVIVQLVQSVRQHAPANSLGSPPAASSSRTENPKSSPTQQRESPEPTAREHESPEPEGGGGTSGEHESPEPSHEGGSSSSPPPDE